MYNLHMHLLSEIEVICNIFISIYGYCISDKCIYEEFLYCKIYYNLDHGSENIEKKNPLLKKKT